MRKQILHLLQLIGINQENYTKAHSQGATQVIPHPRQQDQTSSIQDMANTHPSKKSNNKQKRKKKNRNLSIS